LDIPIPNHLVDQISDRCLRCYKEQQWYGENFLYDFIGDTDVAGQRILEIGCAEAGLLKFYQEKGAIWGFGLDQKTKKIFIAPNNLELEILVDQVKLNQ